MFLKTEQKKKTLIFFFEKYTKLKLFEYSRNMKILNWIQLNIENFVINKDFLFLKKLEIWLAKNQA